MVNGSGVARIDYAPGPVDLSGLDWFGGQFAPDRFVRRMIARTYRTEVRIRWGSLKMARRRPGCVQGSAGRVRGCGGRSGPVLCVLRGPGGCRIGRKVPVHVQDRRGRGENGP